MGLRPYLVRTSARLSGHVHLTVRKKQAVQEHTINTFPGNHSSHSSTKALAIAGGSQ